MKSPRSGRRPAGESFYDRGLVRVPPVAPHPVDEIGTEPSTVEAEPPKSRDGHNRRDEEQCHSPGCDSSVPELGVARPNLVLHHE